MTFANSLQTISRQQKSMQNYPGGKELRGFLVTFLKGYAPVLESLVLICICTGSPEPLLSPHSKEGKQIKAHTCKCLDRGFYKLEKYLNIEGFLEMSMKIKSALKVLDNHSKALKSP